MTELDMRDLEVRNIYYHCWCFQTWASKGFDFLTVSYKQAYTLHVSVFALMFSPSGSELCKIIWNANLMQRGNFVDVFLARHISGTYAHHQEHINLPCCIKLAFQIISWGRCMVKQPSRGWRYEWSLNKSVHEAQHVTPLLVYVTEPQGNCFFKNISVVMYELLTVLFISVALLH